eukprot:gene18789-20680_t
MPVIFSERLPLPSLRSYIAISVCILGAVFVHAQHSAVNEGKELHEIIAHVFVTDSFCFWAAVNIAYCILFSFGKVIQQFVLGDLRVIEEQLTSSPNISMRLHTKLLLLLISILASSIGMSFAAYFSAFLEGWNIFGFMIAECILLGLKCLHIIFKYFIQIRDGYKQEMWEEKAWLSYYSDLTFDCLILTVDLIYHMHMLLWSNVFLSMASLVLYWNIRKIFSEIKKKIRKHRIYCTITQKVKEKFESLTTEELDKVEDHCAICWEDMNKAKKLPCGHIFHQACLCSWLQQDTSCPTCRMSLASIMGLPERNASPLAQDDEDEEDVNDIQQFGDLQQQRIQRNHFFHFDGTRIANWFPSFSIEVFHGANGDDMADLELEEMAVQVHTMFPNIPHEVIVNDLRRTHSLEQTTENILEGNISLDLQREPETEERSEISPAQTEEIQPEIQREDQLASDVTSSENTEAPSESAEENSDAGSCFDDPDRRHEVLSKRRKQFMTEARRRYLTKPAAKELNSNTAQQQSTSSKEGTAKSQLAIHHPTLRRTLSDQEEHDREAIQKGYQDVRDDVSDTIWASFQYKEDGKAIEFGKTGTDFDSLLENFTDDNRMYAYLRLVVGDEMSKRVKFVFITWIGMNNSPLKKAKVSTDKAFIKNVCSNFAVEVLASEKDELKESNLKQLCINAGGAAYGVGVRD